VSVKLLGAAPAASSTAPKAIGTLAPEAKVLADRSARAASVASVEVSVDAQWADDAARVGSSTVLDQWYDQSTTEVVAAYGATTVMTAGTKVPIQLDYFQTTGTSFMMLAAKGPSVPTVPSPRASSLPPGCPASVVPPGARSCPRAGA